MKYFVFALLVSLLVFEFSCSDDKQGTKEKSTRITEIDSSKTNLVVFIIPGFDNAIFSQLKKDQNSDGIHKFNTIGSYSTESYFEDYSDLKSNMSALMSGKTTLINSLGIDKDSLVLPSWVELFKKETYHISLISNGSLGNEIHGAIFPGINKPKNSTEEELIVSNMMRFKPDFVWGMGSNLFKRRKDNRNLFEELSIQGYDLELDIQKSIETDKSLFAGVFNNYSIPDSVDLVLNGIAQWNKIISKTDQPFLLFVTIENIEPYLESKKTEDLLVLNEYINRIFNLTDATSQNTLFLIINPFQDRNRVFFPSKNDSLSYTSTSLIYNETNNNIWASGKNSDLFSGYYRNTDLYKKIELLKKK